MKPRNRGAIALLLVTLAIIPIAGCGAKVNSTNPAVIQAVAVRDAEQSVKTIEDGLTAAANTVNDLSATEPEYAAHIRPLIRRLSAANAVASSKLAIVAQGGTADWKSALIEVGRTVTPADLTAFGFKNKNSQAIAQAGFSLLVGALTALEGKYQ